MRDRQRRHLAAHDRVLQRALRALHAPAVEERRHLEEVEQRDAERLPEDEEDEDLDRQKLPQQAARRHHAVDQRVEDDERVQRHRDGHVAQHLDPEVAVARVELARVVVAADAEQHGDERQYGLQKNVLQHAAAHQVQEALVGLEPRQPAERERPRRRLVLAQVVAGGQVRLVHAKVVRRLALERAQQQAQKLVQHKRLVRVAHQVEVDGERRKHQREPAGQRVHRHHHHDAHHRELRRRVVPVRQVAHHQVHAGHDGQRRGAAGRRVQRRLAARHIHQRHHSRASPIDVYLTRFFTFALWLRCGAAARCMAMRASSTRSFLIALAVLALVAGFVVVGVVTGTDCCSTPFTDAPTSAPTPPTVAPTSAPTSVPTVAPTKAPTGAPTVAPTKAPTGAPTGMPTAEPTPLPTAEPPK